MVTSRLSRGFLIAMVIWVSLASSYSVLRGSLHDYPAYEVIWKLIADGGDPWLGSLQARNAYGPVNVLFTPLISVHALLPKILMLLVFLITNVLIAWRIACIPSNGWRIAIYSVLVPLNGGVIVWGIAYGSNDILVAGLVGLALLLRLENQLVWAGIVLGIAVLFKFYPALLVLLFSVDRRSISFRLLFSSAITVCLGLLVPFVIWGGNSFNWLLFAAERGTSQLSIWNLIINEPSMSSIHGLAFWAIDFNALILVTAFGAWLSTVWVKGVPWLPASICGLLIVLMLYKVGHGQFWMTWLVLSCGLLIATVQGGMRLAVATIPAAVGASLVGYIYDARRQLSLPWEPVQQSVGWMLFVLTAITAVSIVVIVLRQAGGGFPPTHTQSAFELKASS